MEEAQSWEKEDEEQICEDVDDEHDAVVDEEPRSTKKPLQKKRRKKQRRYRHGQSSIGATVGIE